MALKAFIVSVLFGFYECYLIYFSFIVKMIEDPVGRVQPKYILLLRRAFETIKHKKWLDDVDWLNFFLTLAEFQKIHASKSASKKE